MKQFDLKYIKSTLEADKKDQKKFKSYYSNFRDIQYIPVNISSSVSALNSNRNTCFIHLIEHTEYSSRKFQGQAFHPLPWHYR